MAQVYEIIIKYIDEHIAEEIKLDEIAGITGYSLHHIYKIFKVYSPYPIKEYIRRKKLYAAANELYSGRKIFDIALDYGYETPAGFFKAFNNVFGCSPSTYKNNIKKGDNNMIIDNIKNAAELNEALGLIKQIYPKLNVDLDEDQKYSRVFWLKQMGRYPQLMLYAKDNEKICGILLGWDDDGKYITVGYDGAINEYKNKGVHEALFVEIEKRAKELGFKGIVLGIGEGEEEFYAKLGYIGKTLIQSKKHSIESLLKFNEQYKNYEVTGTSVYEGHINQIWLNVSLLDRELKKKFENELGDCWVQVIVNKNI